jgi:protein-disulfide isomerase
MNKDWLIPGAIVFAGLVIAISLYVIHYHAAVVQNGNPAAVRPVDASDHIIGNPAAPVVLIEYADIDSEYSKEFQPIMEQLMRTYGPSGNVAWVYRNFPLIGVDTNAEEHAEAAECVAAQGGAQNGTTDFFAFIDALETAAPNANEFDPKGYDAIVSQLGFSVPDFNTCLSSGAEKKRVEADYQNALAVGADGSPFTVLLVRGQKPAVISGALPYDVMKQVIDTSIAKVLNTGSTGN